MQKVGLATLYSSDNKVRKFCRKLLALPFLPPATIAETFQKMYMGCSNSLIRTVCDYILRNTFVVIGCLECVQMICAHQQ